MSQTYSILEQANVSGRMQMQRIHRNSVERAALELEERPPQMAA